MNCIFNALPYFLKVPVTGLIASRKKQQKYGDYFQKEFDFLATNDVSTQSRKAEEDLAIFMDFVSKNYKYYSIGEIRNPDALPILSKNELLKNYESLNLGKSFKIVKSSGTTGVPLAVPYSKRAYQKEYAFWWYHRSFCGVKRGDRIATFAGHKVASTKKDSPPFWVFNWAENQLLFSSYHMSMANMPHYLAKLNTFKPLFIHGYPSSIYFVARYILDNNLSLDFVPKMIATASETTLDFHRLIIEKAFKTKLYIWYGNTEYCGHITECTKGKLHVQPYHSYVRVLKSDGTRAGLGEEGNIVATNFTNTAFPLINYDTKDVVRVSEKQECNCKRGGMIVDYILGRIEDYILTPDGRYVGRLDHLFKDARHVKNAQIEQRTENILIIRIEAAPGYNREVENSILEEARCRLGNKMKIEFEYVQEIPKGFNGKFNFVIQNIQTRIGSNS